MATFTSECDSNTFSVRNAASFTYFFSLTTDMDHLSQNPRVPTAKDKDSNNPGVRVHIFFVSGYLSNPFPLQSMAPLKEGDQWQMWEFIPI